MHKTIRYLMAFVAVFVFYPLVQGQTTPLPPLWSAQDIGSLQIAGSAQYQQASDSFSLTGSGSNIGDNTTGTDNFHFAYQDLSVYQKQNPNYFNGNCVISTYISSVNGPSPWSKAGLMMRQSLNPSASYVALVLTPGNGLNLDVRGDNPTNPSLSTGYLLTDPKHPGVPITGSHWVRLIQTANNQFTAQYANTNPTPPNSPSTTPPNPQDWVTLKTVTVPMSGPIFTGLAVTSHNASKTALGTFAGTRITPTADPLDFTTLPTEISFNGKSGINGLYGDDTHAYRDPAPFYYNGIFYVFYSYTTRTTYHGASVTYWQVAYSTSSDLKTWTAPTPITPQSTALNYSSPGSIVIDGNQFVLCLQTYPTYNNSVNGFAGSSNNNVGFGSNSCYIWMTRSSDLANWTPITSPGMVISDKTAYDPRSAGLPSLDVYGLNVHGSPLVVPGTKRTIDPFLVQDKDDSTKWWCFYKSGSLIKTSFSTDDMKTWTPSGTPGITGENSCVVVDTISIPSIYRFLYSLTSKPPGGVSPLYGMGYSNSQSLTTPTWSSTPSGYFTPVDVTVFPTWMWNPGSVSTPKAVLSVLSAGAVLDLRNEPHVGKHALMFFHGGATGSGEKYFAGNNSLGLVWTTGSLETNPWTYSLTPNGQ